MSQKAGDVAHPAKHARKCKGRLGTQLPIPSGISFEVRP
jgi:hypothetical protein